MKKIIRSAYGGGFREKENEDDKKKNRRNCVQAEDTEMRNNKITSWVKIGPPWSHLKASLMILISGNDTLCRQTKKKKRMRAKKKVVLE